MYAINFSFLILSLKCAKQKLFVFLFLQNKSKLYYEKKKFYSQCRLCKYGLR